MVPCKSTAEEVSFEWSHHKILSTDSKVRTTLHVSITDSGRERANKNIILIRSRAYTFLLVHFILSFRVNLLVTRVMVSRQWFYLKELRSAGITKLFSLNYHVISPNATKYTIKLNTKIYRLKSIINL